MPANARATLVYDGDCGICRYWVQYWQKLTGGRVAYRPYQEAAAEFPAIPLEAFARAIQLIEPDGNTCAGAAATFRLLRYAPGRAAWWWIYEHVPGFAPTSEWAYGYFARRRGQLSCLTHLLWGAHLEPETYDLVSWGFLRLLGAIYVMAFASLGVQILGLIGKEGILPAGEYLEAARHGWGLSAYWRMPTLFWLNASDAALLGVTGLGVLLGLLVTFGIRVRAALIGLFLLYLSCVYAGQAFMSYQWDLLLLESGFLAIFLTAGSRIIVWLYRWLVFRYLLMSGIVKALSAQPTWHDLTALKYYFLSQPLPTPLAWYAARLPPLLLSIATAATLVIELILVFLIFLPRNLRAVAGWCILVFQALIMLTGNYGFFNLLTMALCVFLFDDAAIRNVMPRSLTTWIRDRALRPGRGATACALVLALVVVPVGLDRVAHALSLPRLPVFGSLAEVVSPWLIVNAYGPFATTTKTRPEIIIQGSDDDENWREYVFRYKPGPVDRAPSWNIPHQPRLDWQMWFAAYGSFAQNAWFDRFLRRLLEGSTPVLGLLDRNPFPDHPPQYVRALLFDYQFASRGARTGQWWVRREEGLYAPELSLKQ